MSTWLVTPDTMVVGGMRCPDPRLPFQRGPVVLGREFALQHRLILHQQSKRPAQQRDGHNFIEAEGNVVDELHWLNLICSREAYELPRSSWIVVSPHPALWIFGPSFPSTKVDMSLLDEASLQRLEVDGSAVHIVDEGVATRNLLLLKWSEAITTSALDSLERGTIARRNGLERYGTERIHQGTELAELALALGTSSREFGHPRPSQLAIAVLAYHVCGRHERASAYLKLGHRIGHGYAMAVCEWIRDRHTGALGHIDLAPLELP